MPAVIAIESSQLQRWGGMLRSETVAVAKRVEAAVEAQQSDIHSAALATVGVRSNALKGSIRRTGRGLRRRVRAGSARVDYAPYHEFGARSFGGNAFLIGKADHAAEVQFVRRVAAAVMTGQIFR